MIELTELQLQALDAGAEPRLVDPRTNKAFVLIGADDFERVRELLELDEGLDMHQVAALVDRVMREDDAADPTLQFYQEKYGKRP